MRATTSGRSSRGSPGARTSPSSPCRTTPALASPAPSARAWTKPTVAAPPAPAYAAYLERGASQLRGAIRALTRAETYPAVVHCSAGKDRTGVVCALVMNLLGVDDDTIVRDYALSNLSTPKLLAMRDVQVAQDEDVQRLYGAPPDAMADFLVHLRRTYGDARGYLRRQGLSDDELDRLPALLLED